MTVRKRTLKRTGQTVYDVVVDVGRGEDGRRKRHVQRGFATKTAAQRAERDVLGKVDRHQYRATDQKMTVGTYLERWSEGLTDVRQATRESYRGHVTNYLVPELGRVPLVRLTSVDVKRFISELPAKGKRRELSPMTVRRVHATLHRALAEAVDDGLIHANPASLPKKRGLPRVTRRALEPWSAGELGRFLDHIGDRDDFALYWCAAATAMRRGELLALTWADVDLDAGVASVTRSLVDVHPQPRYEGTKTGRDRAVELDMTTVDVLRAHQRRTGRIAGLVFADPDGSEPDPDRITKGFPKLAAAAGVRQVRFHDLRHGYAMLALKAGVHPKAVQERLGHSSITVTMDIYSSVLRSVARDAAGVVSEELAKAGGV